MYTARNKSSAQGILVGDVEFREDEWYVSGESLSRVVCFRLPPNSGRFHRPSRYQREAQVSDQFSTRKG